jgi:hypothetical protein
MAFNQFEQYRGPVLCGDCGIALGHRIDIDPGTVTLLCTSCYRQRLEDTAASPKEFRIATSFPSSSNVIVDI